MAYAPISRINELAEDLLRTPSEPPLHLHVHKDLEALQRMVRRIRAVLTDAEKMEIHQESVRLWLRELKGVAHDAEDVLDECRYEVLRTEVETGIPQARVHTASSSAGAQRGKPFENCFNAARCVLVGAQYIADTFKNIQGRSEAMWRRWLPKAADRPSSHAAEVSDLAIVSVSSDASFWGTIEDRIGKIRGRFEDILKHRDGLHLREGDGERWWFQSIEDRPPSSHHVDAPTIHGRREDLEKMISRLLCSDECKESNLSVLPIVGMGGVGKTTLAQHLYNDQKIHNHFPMKGWVCVSDDFTVPKLTKRIIESLTREECRLNELSTLQENLVNILLDGKRFLLVLDDVLNLNPTLWESLRKPLIFGAQGSVVITTTRDESVAKIMQTMPFHHLDCLHIDDCWAVFRESAFVDRVIDGHPDLIKIGYKIVKKCGGLPLAAKSLGSLLRCEEDVDKWEEVLQSNIWDLGGQNDGIIPALRLSYLYLPSYLKHCFLYTALFPKDFRFIKEDLILQWMAQGFVQFRGNKQAEDVGNAFFNELVQRSFFQAHGVSLYKEPTFVMHDLIHDLAQHITDQEFFHIQGEKAHVHCPKEVHHVSALEHRVGDLATMLHSLSHCAPLAIRTLVIRRMTDRVPDLKFPTQMMPELRLLRALDLRHTSICELPDSVSNLKLLRYLNLASTDIVRLPDSVCKLYNLQTLCLRYCYNLRNLPKGIKDLRNLRCLKIEGNKVHYVPRGIGKLINLRTLDELMVGRGWQYFFDASFVRESSNNLLQISNAECSGIEELKDLIHLRGTLKISILSHVMNAEEARLADLRNKRNIKKLFLSWSTSSLIKNKFPVEYAPLDVQMKVMENLQPPNRLEELKIHGYDGTSFPSWMAHDPSSLSKLVRIELLHCQCISLPPLGQLPSLKYLEIEGMDMVENVGSEFYGYANVGFPALEELQFFNMDKWVTWELATDREVFPCLRYLSVCKCPKLESMASLHLIPALQQLAVCLCRKLKSIDLWSVPSPSSCSSSLFSSIGPPPLRSMSIKNCRQARFLPTDDDAHLLLPATLQVLVIDHLCPLLVDWCARGRGSKLAHIPNAKVWTLGSGEKMVATWKNAPISQAR